MQSFITLLGQCPPPVLVSSSAGSITVQVSNFASGNPVSCVMFRDDCAGGAFTVISSAQCGALVVSSNLPIDGNCRFQCAGVSADSSTGPVSETVIYAAAGPPSLASSSISFSKYGALCVLLSWSPADGQGSPLLCYSVLRDQYDDNWMTVVACDSNAALSSQVVCGLDPSVNYRVGVRAQNRVGISDVLSIPVLLKDLQATPLSPVLSYQPSIKAGQQVQLLVQAVDPSNGQAEVSSVTIFGFPPRIFILQLMNPSSLDSTGAIEIPLSPEDLLYSANPPLPSGAKPFTFLSEDNGNGQYSITYSASAAGNYSLFVRSLEQGGLLGQYWDNQWFFGAPIAEQTDAGIGFNWGVGSIVGFASEFVAVRWSGFLLGGFSEIYTFFVLADDNVRLWIDDVLIIDKWSGICCGEFWGTAAIVQGRYHKVRLDYRQLLGESYCSLSWSSFSQAKTVIPAASLFVSPVLGGMPYSVEVEVGAVLSANSVAFGSQLSETVAGQLSFFYIQAKDSQGNNMTDTSIPFVAEFGIGNSLITATSIPQSALLANGLQVVYFTLTQAGIYTVVVSTGGNPIAGSGGILTVSPSTPSASHSYVSGIGLNSTFSAGVPAILNLTLNDQFGNEALGSADLLVAVTIEWLHYMVNSTVSIGQDSLKLTDMFGTDFVGSAIWAGEAGLYKLSFTALRAGSCSLRVKLFGTSDVLGSPFSVIGVANPFPSGSMSLYVTGYPANSATSGSVVSMQFQLRDAYGNVMSSVPAGTSIEALIGPAPFDYGSSCITTGFGVYSCTVIPGLAGSGRWITVRVNGVDISSFSSGKFLSGPFPLVVAPGLVSASKSTLMNPPTSMFTGGYVPTLLQLRDAFGNELTGGTPTVVASLNGEYLTVTNNGNGSLTALWGVETEGMNMPFLCTINGIPCGNSEALTASGLVALVSPASAIGSYCDVSSNPVAGSDLPFTCNPQDAFGNAVNFSNLIFSGYYVGINGPALIGEVSVSVNATYADDGSYIFSPNLTIVGDYSLEILLGQTGGLYAQYFMTNKFEAIFGNRSDTRHIGYPVFPFTSIDGPVAFSWSGSPFVGMPRDDWSVIWSGWLLPKASGLTALYVEADMGVNLTVNGVELFTSLNSTVALNSSGYVDLVANVPVPITLSYIHGSSPGYVTLSWSNGEFAKTTIPKANLIAPQNVLKTNQSLVTVQAGQSWIGSELKGQGLNRMTAGSQSNLTLYTIDMFGNSRTNSDVHGAGLIGCPPESNATTEICRFRAFIGETVNASLVDNADGTLTLSVTPILAGSASVLTSQVWTGYEWVNMKGSPFNLNVVPGDVVPHKTLISGSLLYQAGVENCLNLTLRDSQNNSVYTSGFNVSNFQVSASSGSVSYLGRGVWSLCSVRNLVGDFSDLEIYIQDGSINLSISVVPGPIKQGGIYNFFVGGVLPGSDLPILVNTVSSIILNASDSEGNQITGDQTLEVVCFAYGRESTEGSTIGIENSMYERHLLDVSNLGNDSWSVELNLPKSGNWSLDCSVVKQGGLDGRFFQSESEAPIEYTETSYCLGPGSIGKSFQWDGYLKAPISGNWTIELLVGDLGYLWLNDVFVGFGVNTTLTSSIELSANQMVPIQIFVQSISSQAIGCLFWSTAGYSVRNPTAESTYHYPVSLSGLSSLIEVRTDPGPVQAFYRVGPFNNREVVLAWLPPVDTGGQTITGYRLRRRLINSNPTWSVVAASLNALTFTQSNLGISLPYDYEITAVGPGNLLGTSTVIRVFACALPDSPTAPVLAFANSTSLTFTLTPPITTGCGTDLPIPYQYELAWNEGLGDQSRVNSLISESEPVFAQSVNVTVSSFVIGRTYLVYQKWSTSIGWSNWSYPTSVVCCDWLLPSAVSNVTRAYDLPQDSTTISIQWDELIATGTSNVLYYTVYYSPGSYELHQVSTGTNFTLTGDFLSTDSIDNVWRFSVSATTAVGEGPRSERVTFLAVDLPAAPTEPQEGWLYNSSSTAITFEWIAPDSSRVTGYMAYTDNGTNDGNISLLACDNSEQPSNLGCTYNVSQSGIVYNFQVYASNEAGEGSASASFGILAAGVPSAPGQPMSNRSSTSTVAIYMFWSVSSSNGDPGTVKYWLERENNGNWQVIAGPLVDAVYLDTSGIVAYEKYTYRVYAENSVGESEYSSESELIASPANSAPLASYVTSTEDSISIIWTSPSEPPQITAFNIYVDGILVDSADPSAALEYVLEGCITGNTYDVKVSAVSLAGESDLSGNCCRKVCARRPYVPRGLTLTTASRTEISISWSPPLSDGGAPLSGYVIQRGIAGIGSFSEIARVDVVTLTYSDSTVTSGTTYLYRVYAINAVNSGVSCQSPSYSGCDLDSTAQLEISACTVSGPPVLSRGQVTSDASVMIVNWFSVDESAINGGCETTGYRIYANSGLNDAVTLVYDGSADPLTCSFNLTGLVQSRVYWLAASTDSLAGEGPLSVRYEFKAAKSADPPSDIVFDGIVGNLLTVKWSWSGSNGGSQIDGWALSTGPSTGNQGALVSLISAQPLSHTFDCSAVTGTDGNQVSLVGTAVYVKVAAVTEVGIGSFAYGSIWCANLPIAPIVIEDTSIASTTQLGLSISVPDSSYTFGAPILGFRVYGGTLATQLTLYSNIAQSSSLASFSLSGLTPQSNYYFRVSIVTSVGEGALSDVAVLYTCGSAPAVPIAPYRGSGSTGTEMKIAWSAVAINGCVVTGYRLFRQYLSDASPVSVYPSGAYTSLTDPMDGSLAASFDFIASISCVGFEGQPVRFKLRAYSTKGGFNDSETVAILCGGLPSQMSAPIYQPGVSGNLNSLSVGWSVPALNNGQLIGFLVYRNSGGSTALSSVPEPTCSSLVSQQSPLYCVIIGVSMGDIYQVAVAAITTIGTSPISPTSFLQAGTIPSAPSTPVNTFASDTDVPWLEFDWNAPLANGSPILYYSFRFYHRVAGVDNLVSSWDGPSGSPASTHLEISSALVPSIAAANQYRLCVIAVNAVGPSSCSSLSGIVAVSSSNLSGFTLSGPGFGIGNTLVRSNSSPVAGFIEIEWTGVTSFGGDILANIEYEIWGGLYLSESALGTASSHSFTATVPIGETWNFKVRARNTRGDWGDFSRELLLTSCGLSSEPTSVLVVGDADSVVMSWMAPTDPACTYLTGYVVSYASQSVSLSSSTTSYVIGSRSTVFTSSGDVAFSVVATNPCGSGASATVTCDPVRYCSSGNCCTVLNP